MTFIFYIPEQKGPLLAVCDKTHSQHPEYEASAQCARQTIMNGLLRHYNPVYYLLQRWSSFRKRTGFAGNV